MKITGRNRIFPSLEIIENLSKFTPIWELKLTNFNWVVKFMNLISQVNYFSRQVYLPVMITFYCNCFLIFCLKLFRVYKKQLETLRLPFTANG